MAVDPTTPVFLERSSYRQRRMMDAVRLLPLIGMLLWMVPLLWPVQEASDVVQPVKMSQAIAYVFWVWLGLIICTAILWWRLRRFGNASSDGALESQD